MNRIRPEFLQQRKGSHGCVMGKGLHGASVLRMDG